MDAPGPYVIDTTVVVAGLLTRRAESPTARALDGMLSGSFPFALSQDLLVEYRTVLLRPKIARRHGLEAEEVDEILTEIALHAAMLTPRASSARAPGSGEQHLWALLASHPCLILITGDKKLLAQQDFPYRVITAQEFLDARFS